MNRRLALHGLMALAALLARPTEARAYLIDLNDARVVEHGTMELELQPVGYWQTVVGEEEHYLVAPSAQIYWGFGEGWDLLLLTRGWALLDDVPDQSRYALQEQMIATRTLLVDGGYSSEGERDGISLALQTGLLLPGVEAETGFGASLALLFAQRWDAGTLHLNVWTNFTQERTFELFVAAVMEGPDAWPVVPTIEVWFDLDDGVPMLSGLVGALIPIGDEFALQGGVRMGGWEGWLDLEVRVSTWIYWDVFDAS
ncbi:MAG: hypothetical protein RLO52_03970 [Sandaracinaceae bacterium]